MCRSTFDAKPKWDKNITAELWHFAIQHAATIYNTTKGRSQDYNISPWEKIMGERSKLDQHDINPLFCPVYVLDRRMQEGTSPPKWTKRTTQQVYVGHLHHYSKSLPMVWDLRTKLVSPQYHVMFDDNFDTIEAPDPKITHADTMDLSFKKKSIKMMILLEINTPIYFLRGEWTYTQTTYPQTPIAINLSSVCKIL
jgi:hypothetical protein